MNVLALPALPASPSADQVDAWLAAFAEASIPTPAEEAAALLEHASAFRVRADTARKAAADQRLPEVNREVLTMLAMQAELAATECIRAADHADPVPF